MKESIKSIIEWHEQTFGDAETLDGQMQKFLTERKEWLDSDRKDIKELADMLIVAAGIGRFDAVMAAECIHDVIAEQYHYTKYKSIDLCEAVNKKMGCMNAGNTDLAACANCHCLT